MASARNDGEKDGARDDRVLTSEGRQSLHITQLSWKINSLRSGQWCQQRAGRPAPKSLLPSISIGISPAHPEHGQSGPGSSSLTMSLHYYFLFFVLSNHLHHSSHGCDRNNLGGAGLSAEWKTFTVYGSRF